MTNLFSDEYPKDLDTAVHVLGGYASACWDNLSGAGVFDSERAHQGCLDLIEWIEKNYVPKESSESFATQWATISTLRRLSDVDQLECQSPSSFRGWVPLSDSYWNSWTEEVLWRRMEEEENDG